MSLNRPDILILGGGILGSSAAWHLARMGAGEIVVLDLDLSGRYSSSELNAGGARALWWNPVNVQFAWHSLKFYQSIAQEIQFFQRGYLFLYHPSSWKIARQKKSLYEDLKIPVRYLEPGEIHELLPEFRNLKGVAGATFSSADGLLDPHLLKEYYRHSAKQKGVRFLDGFYSCAIRVETKKVSAVETLHHEMGAVPDAQIQEILCTHLPPQGPAWKRERFEPKVLLNCTGAWLPITSRLYHRPLPVRALRRQVSLFSSHGEDLSGRGMIVDASGLYFHPEGEHSGLILAGYSNRDEKPGYRFDYDGEPFFDRRIWLRLYHRGGRQHFAALKHVRGWAGLYAVGPDNTGILGKAEGLENLYELGAATGRGVMQSYALGLAMAELITQNAFQTLDATPLNPQRFKAGPLQPENLDI